MSKWRKTYPRHHVLKQPCGIPTTLRVRLGAKVEQVPGIVVAITEHLQFDVVQPWQDLVEIAPASLGRQLEVQAPQAAAQLCPPAVEVLAGRNPVVVLVLWSFPLSEGSRKGKKKNIPQRHAIALGSHGRHQPAQAMRRDGVSEDVDV